MLLHGIFSPITTPFYPDGNVYFKKLEANVERYSKTPVAGIVVLGSTGEAIMLSDEERREVLKTALAATANHKVLVEALSELADRRNLFALKESGGDVEKVRKMVEGTRHVKRAATVTETFEAVTPRMLKATAENSGQGRELVPVAVLAGSSKPSSSSRPSSSAVTVVSVINTAK